mmetsp:Transcript_29413/g.67656  ORF Transcript_29413/g.67656 Transcript_29413/m.67656 type:complete len:98 (-) Transcript_29413:195-488(-)
MIHLTIIHADWKRIQQNRRQNQLANNIAENRSRVEHNYKVGDKVLIKIQKTDRKHKLGRPTDGPFIILAIRNNGTVQIKRRQVREWINICRLHPYTN